jgi:hypothetical protein
MATRLPLRIERAQLRVVSVRAFRYSNAASMRSRADAYSSSAVVLLASACRSPSMESSTSAKLVAHREDVGNGSLTMKVWRRDTVQRLICEIKDLTPNVAALTPARS